MKIFIACSKHFYEKIPKIQRELEDYGHVISLPNSYDEPFKEEEEEIKKRSLEEHIKWKSEMLLMNEINIFPNHAILVLNFEKNGQPNYIGGATFLEIYTAWRRNKKIFLYNPFPENNFTDELKGMNPKIINQDLSRIK